MESNLFQKPVVTVGDNKTEPVNDKATTNTIELGKNGKHVERNFDRPRSPMTDEKIIEFKHVTKSLMASQSSKMKTSMSGKVNS